MDKETLPELINNFLTKKEDQQSFRDKLYTIIQDLLMNDTGHLYQALYRIDVKEEKVKKVFEDNPLLEVAAERITQLIIDRQIEKIQWRERYKT
jgi:hypothetical protein